MRLFIVFNLIVSFGAFSKTALAATGKHDRASSPSGSFGDLRMLASVTDRHGSSSSHSNNSPRHSDGNGQQGLDLGLGLGQPRRIRSPPSLRLGSSTIAKGGGKNDQEATSSRKPLGFPEIDKGKGKRSRSPSPVDNRQSKESFKLFGKEIKPDHVPQSKVPRTNSPPKSHQAHQSSPSTGGVRILGYTVPPASTHRLFGVTLHAPPQTPTTQQQPVQIHSISSGSGGSKGSNKSKDMNPSKPLKVRKSPGDSESSFGPIKSGDSGFRSTDALSRKMSIDHKPNFTSTSKYSRRNKLETGKEVYIHAPYPRSPSSSTSSAQN